VELCGNGVRRNVSEREEAKVKVILSFIGNVPSFHKATYPHQIISQYRKNNDATICTISGVMNREPFTLWRVKLAMRALLTLKGEPAMTGEVNLRSEKI
jgi:hypothetical protein